METELIKRIEEYHKGDKEQLEVILSNQKRLIVEAPAGYGKTKTMISKIAYLIATERISYPKRVLALTFSVNAAYKIKKDVAENLPVLLATQKVSPVSLRNKVFASNYHGFCRRVLRLYGYLLHENLRNIELLKVIDDGNVEELVSLGIGIDSTKANEISNFNDAVKKINRDYLNNNSEAYLADVATVFLPNNYIPFNAILLLTIDLFKKYPQILDFYKNYFPAIIVDEFQDTNLLSWSLLNKLIDKNDNAQVVFMGDSLQRIYGFIGAIPDLMNIAQKKYGMYPMQLKTNHRFKDNPILLKLDKNLRENAANPRDPIIEAPVNIELYEAPDQQKEAEGVLGILQSVFKKDQLDKVAILVKQRGNNVDKILSVLRAQNVNFFYALFSDEDKEYIKFHKVVLSSFLKILSSGSRINRATCDKLLKEVKEQYNGEDSEFLDSLYKLLQTFLRNIFVEFIFLSGEEKIDFILDTLENNSLKQYLSHVDSQVIVSTIHGAKGLEWAYVILPDMEKNSFPNFPALCIVCNNRNSCNIDWNQIPPGVAFENKFYEELSVFYVAATRAQKNIFFSYSKKRIAQGGQDSLTNLSCLLKLPGINHSIIQSRVLHSV